MLDPLFEREVIHKGFQKNVIELMRKIDEEIEKAKEIYDREIKYQSQASKLSLKHQVSSITLLTSFINSVTQRISKAMNYLDAKQMKYFFHNKLHLSLIDFKNI